MKRGKGTEGESETISIPETPESIRLEWGCKRIKSLGSPNTQGQLSSRLGGDPGAETLGVTTGALDARRPRDSLGLGGGGGIFDGIHLERALALDAERWEDVLLGLLAEGLAFPCEKVQEEDEGGVEAAVGHVDTWADMTTVGQVDDAELVTALTGHVGAALAAVESALGEVLVGAVKGDVVAVGGHQVADDEHVLRDRLARPSWRPRASSGGKPRRTGLYMRESSACRALTYILDTVVLVGLGAFAVVDLPDGLVAVLMRVGSIGEVADDPAEPVAQVDPGGDARVRGQDDFFFQENLAEGFPQESWRVSRRPWEDGEELLELGVDAGGVDGQQAERDLGRECLAGADETVAVGRGADGPDARRGEFAVEELEGRARLVGGLLLDDGLGQRPMAVDQDGLAAAERDADHVGVLLRPFGNLENVAPLAQLRDVPDDGSPGGAPGDPGRSTECGVGGTGHGRVG